MNKIIYRLFGFSVIIYAVSSIFISPGYISGLLNALTFSNATSNILYVYLPIIGYFSAIFIGLLSILLGFNLISRNKNIDDLIKIALGMFLIELIAFFIWFNFSSYYYWLAIVVMITLPGYVTIAILMTRSLKNKFIYISSLLFSIGIVIIWFISLLIYHPKISSDCSKLKYAADSDVCYNNFAIKNKDGFLCNKISSIHSFNFCLDQLAELTLDQTLCNDYKEFDSYSEFYSYESLKNKCISNVAWAKKDSSICEEISLLKIKESCITRISIFKSR